LMATVFYYLVLASMIHTHVRYGLPMHALLTIFAALTLWRLKEFAGRWLGNFGSSAKVVMS